MTIKTIVKEILNFTSHNTGLTLGSVLAAIVIVFIYSCESQVQSIVEPQKKVTRPELKIEVENFLAIAEIRYRNLDRQDAFKNMLLKHALLWAEAGTINPFALLIALQGIIGTGAIIDNATKRRKERKLIDEHMVKTNNNG